jgi:hypothetical protein
VTHAAGDAPQVDVAPPREGLDPEAGDGDGDRLMHELHGSPPDFLVAGRLTLDTQYLISR